jgi:WD40 repeat protein/serine/threonine protein kinase
MMSNTGSERNVVEVLAEEFLARKRRGENPSLSEYTEQHPELAEEIQNLFPAMVLMEDFKPSVDTTSTGVDGQPLPAEEFCPRDFGDYRIIREVGRGGMGIVYEAEQISLGRHVALKLLPGNLLLDSKHKQRFQREAKAAAKLHHTHIVPVFGVGQHDGMHYFVMQFIQGLGLDQVLDELIRRHQQHRPRGDSEVEPRRAAKTDLSAVRIAVDMLSGPGQLAPHEPSDETTPFPASRMSGPNPEQSDTQDTGSASTSSITLPRPETREPSYWNSVADIGLQVARALEYAHNQGVLHRDIKPANLLLDVKGTVWVTDFGVAKVEDQLDLTHSGDMLGTLRYMSPEVFQGTSDARTDVHGLGLTVYELLALKPAFEGSNASLIQKVANEEPARLDRLNPAIPRDLITIVHKAINRDPQLRYQSAADLADDLERFIHDEPITARRTTLAEQFFRWWRRNPTIATLSTSIAVMLMAAVVISSSVATGYRRLATYRENARETMAKERDKLKLANDRVDHLHRSANRNLYVAHMNLVQNAVEAGDPHSAIHMLKRYLPRPAEEELRRFEWYYWWRLCHSRALSIKAHKGMVLAAAYSPDGSLLATCGDGVVKLWHAETGQLRLTLQDSQPLQSLAFSSDGTTLATGMRNGGVKLWDALTGRGQETLRGHTEIVSSLAFSPDGRMLITGSNHLAIVWDLETREKQATLRDGGCVAFSPNSKIVATGTSQGDVKLWDASTGEETNVLRRGARQWKIVKSVAFAGDGNTLAAAYNYFQNDRWSSEIVLWTLDSATQRTSIGVNAQLVNSVAFSPNDKMLASAGADRKVRLWNLATKEAKVFYGHSRRVQTVAFSPNGKRLVSAGRDAMVNVWDVEEVNTLKIDSSVESLAFSPDGKALVATGGVYKQWDVDTRQEITTALDGLRAYGAAIAPDGMVALGGESAITVWNPNTGRTIRLRGHRSFVHSLAFTHDGTTLASSSDDKAVILWDLRSGRIRHKIEDRDVKSVVFSADGSTLATGGVSVVDGEEVGQIDLWDVATGRLKQTLHGHSAAVLSVAFSPNGSLLASGSRDHTIRLWELKTGEVRNLRGHAAAVNSLTFSSHGSLASGSNDRTIKLWDPNTGETTATLKGHPTSVSSVAFSPDGSLLVSGADDGRIRMWPAANEQEVAKEMSQSATRIFAPALPKL